jgi:hypothetical protein
MEGRPVKATTIEATDTVTISSSVLPELLWGPVDNPYITTAYDAVNGVFVFQSAGPTDYRFYSHYQIITAENRQWLGILGDATSKITISANSEGASAPANLDLVLQAKGTGKVKVGSSQVVTVSGTPTVGHAAAIGAGDTLADGGAFTTDNYTTGGAGVACKDSDYYVVRCGYSQIVSLWTACTSGYLKFNGTCDTPSVGTPGGSSGDIQWNNSSAFAGAGPTWDNTNKKISTPQTTSPDEIDLRTGSGAGTNYVGRRGPATNPSTSFILQDTPTEPTANQIPYVVSVSNHVGVWGWLTFGTGVITAAGNNLSAAGGLTTTIASGSLALATSEIASYACQTVTQGSVNSAAATNVATTDVITFMPNGSIKTVTGYTPAAAGGLTVTAYPTAGYVNFDVCNWTVAAITPGAVTVNWRVVR